MTRLRRQVRGSAWARRVRVCRRRQRRSSTVGREGSRRRPPPRRRYHPGRAGTSPRRCRAHRIEPCPVRSPRRPTQGPSALGPGKGRGRPRGPWVPERWCPLLNATSHWMMASRRGPPIDKPGTLRADVNVVRACVARRSPCDMTAVGPPQSQPVRQASAARGWACGTSCASLTARPVRGHRRAGAPASAPAGGAVGQAAHGVIRVPSRMVASRPAVVVTHALAPCGSASTRSSLLAGTRQTPKSLFTTLRNEYV